MLDIVRAIHQKITASACSEEFSAECARLLCLLIERIDLRVRDLTAHALLALPTIVEKFSEAVKISLQKFILHRIGKRLDLAHRVKRILLLVVLDLVLNDICRNMDISGVAQKQVVL